MPSKKINIRERLEDDKLDLSMSDLDEVPVKDIIQIKKATNLDLSNNRIAVLGKNFPTLTHLTRLDLSKNHLTELPENFGDLKLLKYLDLYSNKLTHLPLSFCELKHLKWLDLKNNPLIPGVAKVAGDCLDVAECRKCAHDVVQFMQLLYNTLAEERMIAAELRRQEQTKLEENQEQSPNKSKKEKKKKKKGDKSQANQKDSKNLDEELKKNQLQIENTFDKNAKIKAGYKSRILKALFYILLPFLFLKIYHYTNNPKTIETLSIYINKFKKYIPNDSPYLEIIGDYTQKTFEILQTSVKWIKESQLYETSIKYFSNWLSFVADKLSWK